MGCCLSEIWWEMRSCQKLMEIWPSNFEVFLYRSDWSCFHARHAPWPKLQHLWGSWIWCDESSSSLFAPQDQCLCMGWERWIWPGWQIAPRRSTTLAWCSWAWLKSLWDIWRHILGWHVARAEGWSWLVCRRIRAFCVWSLSGVLGCGSLARWIFSRLNQCKRPQWVARPLTSQIQTTALLDIFSLGPSEPIWRRWIDRRICPRNRFLLAEVVCCLRPCNLSRRKSRLSWFVKSPQRMLANFWHGHFGSLFDLMSRWMGFGHQSTFDARSQKFWGWFCWGRI